MAKVIFFGYSAMGYEGLEYLIRQKEEIAAVISHRDKEEENIWFPSVPKLAKEAGIPLYYGEEMSSKELKELVASLEPDIILSIYYRNLIPGSVLKMARIGAYNLHGSLLPRFRGRCPTNWQILKGETVSGVTLHVMERKADTGPIVGQKRIPIEPRETAFTLAGKQIRAARELLAEVFPRIKRQEHSLLPQDHSLASYFGGRTPEDGRIDWNESAVQIDRLVRAVTHPYPGAFTTWKERKLLIWEAYPMGGEASPPGKILGLGPQGILVATGSSLLEILKCQLEGEEELSAHEFWHRYSLQKGERLE
ncbi:MAG: formyltransferase [Planctomycetota bacterium]|nr:MAG: formyltransferase [Planctomycetota bacterium]